MTGVNTNMILQRNFTWSGTSAADRVTREDAAFYTTLTFHPVAMTDGGRYVCSAIAVSTPQYPNVKTSDATMNNTMAIISSKKLPLPPPYTHTHVHAHTHTHTHACTYKFPLQHYQPQW